MPALVIGPDPAPDPAASGLPVLRFAAGLPGFPHAHRFTLEPWGDDSSPFCLLRCADDDELAFVVVPPAVFFPDYEPVIDDATVQRLGVADADDVQLLAIVTLGERAADATANLLGPIVVNRSDGEACQPVLAGQRWTSRTPLTA